MNTVKVELMLDLATIKYIEDIAELSGRTTDDVANIILAAEMLKRGALSGPKKKTTNKRRNGSASKKPRLAKRR